VERVVTRLYACEAPTDRIGRRRKAEPPVVVTVVLGSGNEVVEIVLASDSALARAMGQLAGLLGHW